MGTPAINRDPGRGAYDVQFASNRDTSNRWDDDELVPPITTAV